MQPRLHTYVPSGSRLAHLVYLAANSCSSSGALAHQDYLVTSHARSGLNLEEYSPCEIEVKTLNRKP